MSDHVSRLHQRLQEYLAVRRAMGFKMERHAKLLGSSWNISRRAKS
ncbi:hypothetical protein ACIBO2_28935 [Nonomuraea sp. NPDC050022]